MKIFEWNSISGKNRFLKSVKFYLEDGLFNG